jgi:hypothetical protein
MCCRSGQIIGRIQSPAANFPVRFGPVAQRLEQATHNRLVPGSNPGGPTNSRPQLNWPQRGAKGAKFQTESGLVAKIGSTVGREKTSIGSRNRNIFFVPFVPLYGQRVAVVRSVQCLNLAASRLSRSSMSRKPWSWRMRVGCRILRKALASIWRMRSRVTRNCLPTSSKVRA